MTLAALAADFRARFGAQPRLFRAPGRINIIGEHTDYSEGFVLPAAIDRWCVVAAAPNGLAGMRVVSQTLGEETEADLAALTPRGDWTLVQSTANGQTCILAMGEAWEAAAPHLPG